MAHNHDVYDTGKKFEINGTSRFIKETSATKTVFVKGDHNSEVITFSMPRYIDGHDMMLCNKIRVHYINIETGTNNKSADIYEVTDLKICEDCENEDVLVFTWTVEAPAAKYYGPLSFLVKFECTEGDEITYEWNTAKYVGINVLDGIDNSEEFVDKYSNVLEEWYNDLTKGADSIEELNQQAIAEIELAKEDAKEDIQGKADATMAEMNQFSSNAYNSFKNDVDEKAEEALASIPDDYTTLAEEVSELSEEIDGVKEDLGEFRNEIFTTKTQTITSPNIFNIAYNNTTSNGITATLKNNKITLSGTYDKDYNSTFKIGEITLGAGTYTITGWSDAPTTLARLHFVNGSDIKEVLFDNATTNCRLTITEPTTLTVKVRCYPGFVGNGMIMKPMIVKGQIVPTEYEEYFKPYEQVIVGDLSVEFAEKINTHTNSKNILYGKKWAVCGDSFSNGDWTGSDEAHTITNGKYIGKNATYGYLIGNRNDMNIQHMAFGGRTIATPQNLLSHNCFSDTESPQNYTKIDSDVDYITLYFGINDSHNAPTSDGSDGEILVGEIPLGTINDTTVNTFYGAWNVILPYLIKNYPFAKIGILVSNGCDTDEYRQATIKVAKKHGIPYIDLNGDDRTPCMNRSTNENILSSVRISRTKAFRVSETNGHPNAKAHEYESYFIENFLRSL